MTVWVIRQTTSTEHFVGYDVHITRAFDWGESETNPITLDQWLTYIDSDPEMRLDGYAEAVTPTGTLRYENEGLAVWTAYSRDGIDGNHPWFDYRRGRIVVKNPDQEILAKMVSIAAVFDAKVVGDEGELYPIDNKA